MSQQAAVVQTSTGSEITPVLGNLQSVGPTNQTLPVISAMQSNNSVVPILQSQTQNQQSQYTSQTSKQQIAQHSSVSNSSNDFPQVRKKCY